MNSIAQIPQHDPGFLRSLPRDITLREIARRRRVPTRVESQVDASLGKPKHVTIKFRFTLPPFPESINRQIWGCLTCMNTRSWGWTMPANPDARPRLNCQHCKCPTRHGFVGVIGRTL